MDVLVQVCKGDWQRAMTLSRGESYEERFLRYNFMTHQLVPDSLSRGRRTGVLLFLKINR